MHLFTHLSSCGNRSPEFLFRVLTYFHVDLYRSDGISQANMCMTQTGPYGHPCAILQAYQLKKHQNPFKTIKLNHSDQLGVQPRMANHIRQVYAVFCWFFSSAGLSKALSYGGCESLYLGRFFLCWQTADCYELCLMWVYYLRLCLHSSVLHQHRLSVLLQEVSLTALCQRRLIGKKIAGPNLERWTGIERRHEPVWEVSLIRLCCHR